MSDDQGYCARCGETYHEENLQDCAICRDDICPYHGTWLMNPATNEEQFICNRCISRDGWWKAAAKKTKS